MLKQIELLKSIHSQESLGLAFDIYCGIDKMKLSNFHNAIKAIIQDKIVGHEDLIGKSCLRREIYGVPNYIPLEPVELGLELLEGIPQSEKVNEALFKTWNDMPTGFASERVLKSLLKMNNGAQYAISQRGANKFRKEHELEKELHSKKDHETTFLLMQLWLKQQDRSTTGIELEERDLRSLNDETAQKIFDNRKKAESGKYSDTCYGEAGLFLFKIGTPKALSLWVQMFADTDAKLVTACDNFSYNSKYIDSASLKSAEKIFPNLKVELKKHEKNSNHEMRDCVVKLLKEF